MPVISYKRSKITLLLLVVFLLLLMLFLFLFLLVSKINLFADGQSTVVKGFLCHPRVCK